MNYEAGAMRGNVAKKQQEPKAASAPTPRPYRIEEQIGYMLRRAHQRASAIFQTTIGDPNITPTQYSSMVKLDEYRELSQNLLGRLVGMDKATMQGVVRRLKDRKLVELLINGPAVSRETLKPLNGAEQRQLLELLSRLS